MRVAAAMPGHLRVHVVGAREPGSRDRGFGLYRSAERTVDVATITAIGITIGCVIVAYRQSHI